MIPLEGILDHYGVEYRGDRDGNQKVLCPFHEDSVASASVNLEMGLFNCYGCDVAGDAISLVMHKEGLEFKDAKQFAEGVAGKGSSALPRRADSGSGLLPRKQGTQRGNGSWKSPWSGRDS